MRKLVFLALLVGTPAYAQVSEKFAGSKTPGVPVTLTDGTTGYATLGVTQPNAVTSTAANSTVATANTFQQALAANPARKGCLIVNTGTATLSVYLGAIGGATAAKSIPLAAGASFGCGAGGIVVSDQISVTSATAGNAYVVISQ